jgi:hypothetical protein
MKKNTVFVLGMLVLMLAMGIVLVACPNDTTTTPDEFK